MSHLLQIYHTAAIEAAKALAAAAEAYAAEPSIQTATRMGLAAEAAIRAEAQRSVLEIHKL